MILSSFYDEVLPKMLLCMSKQVKKTTAVSAFFDEQKCSVTSNKNYSATYTANKEKD